jgi:hypothetical protein
MKYLIIMSIALLCNFISSAQQKVAKNKNEFADLAATIGNAQGSVAASYVHNWKFGFGKKKNWEAGFGARLTSTFGNKLEYITAGPAKFTRASTTPFLIVFAGQRTENWDTLTVQSSLVNALNISANFGYNFTSKWSGGFNIDLIGVSFGKTSPAVFVSNGVTFAEPSAKPTPFNLLLTGDHDRGSLNSEFFVKYKLNDKWAIRGIYQFLFTEYSTTNIRQNLPDGSTVNRFRNKANNFGIGVSYHL